MVIVVATATLASAGTGTLKGIVTSGASSTPVANAVVMVDGPPAAAPAPAPAVMDQRDDAFVPHILGVAVGTTVSFPNHDQHLHNVFSASPAKQFDLGMYGTGETRTVTFDKPGVVRIGCNAHPQMTAFVVVHTNPSVAVTDAQGRYTITGVPTGRYAVRVWDERLGDTHAVADIRDGQVTVLDARLKR
jgi:plastocyanin